MIVISWAFFSFHTCKLNFIESLLWVQWVLNTLIFILSSYKSFEISVDYPHLVREELGLRLKLDTNTLLFMYCFDFLILITSPVYIDFVVKPVDYTE